MRAIVYHTYGSPDVLELQEVAKPAPKEQVVITVEQNDKRSLSADDER